MSEGRGSFFFEKERFPERPSVVLLGGGIGITPLLSILQYIHSESLAKNLVAKNVTLVHSVRSKSEVVFQDRIHDIARKNPNIKAYWTITSEEHENPSLGTFSNSRIDLEFLRKLQLDLSGLFFVCGPPPMVKDLVNALHVLGVHSEQIHYEKWR